jgi:hypothetical protein
MTPMEFTISVRQFVASNVGLKTDRFILAALVVPVFNG